VMMVMLAPQIPAHRDQITLVRIPLLLP